MKIEKIYIGGWFQRTTLHLTEVADFLISGKSEMEIDQKMLEEARKLLLISLTERENWLLEYVHTTTQSEIDWRFYEDGLVVLEKKPSGHLKTDFEILEEYYDKRLSPALSLLFSKGAPIPKELAQIKTLLPFIVVAREAKPAEVENFFKDQEFAAYSVMETPYVKVFKSPKAILIVSDLAETKIRQLVESQIFFREFKSQLHRYLSLHRLIWEEIAAIKERGKIAGVEVKALKTKLDGYQKTVQLIDSRINQMSAYLKIRGKISTAEEVDKFLDKVFAYKFETLEDTLSYIKELWKMTANYLASALEVFKDIQVESTKSSISSLQLITTLGVMAAIIGYLGRDKLPYVSKEGAIFFVLLVVLTSLLNRGVSWYFSRRSYTIKKDGHKDIFKIRSAKEEE